MIIRGIVSNRVEKLVQVSKISASVDLLPFSPSVKKKSTEPLTKLKVAPCETVEDILKEILIARNGVEGN